MEENEIIEEVTPVAEEAPAETPVEAPEEAPVTEEAPAAEAVEGEPVEEQPAAEKASPDWNKMVTSALDDIRDGVTNAAEWIRKTAQEQVDAAKQAKQAKQAQTQDDPFEKIEKLSHLRDIGAITLEEFNSKKAELLARI